MKGQVGMHREACNGLMCKTFAGGSSAVDVDCVVDHVSHMTFIRCKLQGWPGILAHGFLEQLHHYLSRLDLHQL